MNEKDLVEIIKESVKDLLYPPYLIFVLVCIFILLATAYYLDIHDKQSATSNYTVSCPHCGESIEIKVVID